MAVVVRLTDGSRITLGTDATIEQAGQNLSAKVRFGGLIDVIDDGGKHHFINSAAILEVLDAS